MGVPNWVTTYLWCNTISGSTHSEKTSNISNAAYPIDDTKVSGFQMPLHYPRFNKTDYEKMDEVRLKLLLAEYGLKFEGSLDDLRAYVIGTFLWPHQL